MLENFVNSRRRVLEPYDRVSEVLFGLIMVLTFTGSLSIAQAGRDDIRAMLIGAIGCNLAWGIIDGVLYLMSCLAEKGKRLLLLRAIRGEKDPEKARRLIAEGMPPFAAALFQPGELEVMRQRLMDLPEPPDHPRLVKAEWLGAVAVCLLVFLSTFPVVIPFIFMNRTWLALRVSNLIAVGMLFLTGCAFGRAIGRKPWAMGVSMVILGTILVGLTMALGG